MALFKFLSGRDKTKRVNVVPSGATFSVSSGQTVLESALKQGLKYPHDCTVGTCGSCRSKLISGQVEAITPFSYTLSKDELEAGYILACQALAKTDLVLDVEIASDQAIVPMTQAAELIAVDTLTHDIKRLTWRLQTPLFWRAGQYGNVRWNGGEEQRSYSFAIAPGRNGSSVVSTFVKRVPGGLFTELVFSGEALNAHFELDAPHGGFWLRESAAPFLCVAGGSGLAPILSLLEDAASHRVRRDCILLFGARAARDLYALEEIAAVKSAWTAGFDFWPVLSEETSSEFRGGLVTEHLPAALSKLGGKPEVYMCGPPPMIDAAISAAAMNGVSLDEIHYDKFTDSSTKA